MRVLSVAVVLAFASARGAGACDGTDPSTWSRGYLALRKTPGHFSGGQWSQDIDAWGGRKHLLMRCLATEATLRSLPAAKLRLLMGPPDEVRHCPDACEDALTKTDWQYGPQGAMPATELWIYDWRGRHDRLALMMNHGVVRGHGWLYLNE